MGSSVDDLEEIFESFLDENHSTNLSSSESNSSSPFPEITNQKIDTNSNEVAHINANVPFTPPTTSVPILVTTVLNHSTFSAALTSNNGSKPGTSTFLKKTTNLGNKITGSSESPSKSTHDKTSGMTTTTSVSTSNSQTLKRSLTPTSSKTVSRKIVKLSTLNTIQSANKPTSSQFSQVQVTQPTSPAASLQAPVSRTILQTVPTTTLRALPTAIVPVPKISTLPTQPPVSITTTPTFTPSAPPASLFSSSNAALHSLSLSVQNAGSTQIPTQNNPISRLQLVQPPPLNLPPILGPSTSTHISNLYAMTNQTKTLGSAVTLKKFPPPTKPASRTKPKKIPPVDTLPIFQNVFQENCQQPTPTFHHVTQEAYEVVKLIDPLKFTHHFVAEGYFKAEKMDTTEPQYNDILEYVSNGQAHQNFGLELLSVLKISQPTAQATSTVASPTQNPEATSPPNKFTMMLWHGTKPKNIASILKEGFRCPLTGYQMFGQGVYFADRISKSAQYCHEIGYVGRPTPGEIGYLFLCEVTLGKCYNAKNIKQSCKTAPQVRKRDGTLIRFDSLKCTGENVPDRQLQREIDGVIWPLGPTIKNTSFPSFTVLYNEFIVYNPEMVKIKYLVKVQFK